MYCLEKKSEKYDAAKHFIVNMFLKRTNPTWVNNNNIHCQKTNVCGEKSLSKFNILETVLQLWGKKCVRM